ncbi:MAG: glycosyltransferase family 2 protein [Verrucomicrobia bacterium]|nr:glycosyltransferase family 2 protein [Verrucomicrobiota bacterium]
MNAAPSGSVTLLVPVLNEIDGLRAVIPQVDRSLFHEILVVDGGSIDGTAVLAEEMGLSVYRQKRPGLGFGVLEGVRLAKSEYVIEFSPDGNCLAEDLPALVAKLREGYDVVVMSRYLPPAKSHDDTWITALGNWMFSQMIAALSRAHLTDALTMYRGFRRELFVSAEFERYVVGPVFEPLISGWASLHRMKMTELPSDEPPRLAGEKKMRILYNGGCVLWMVLRLYLLRINRLRRSIRVKIA